MINAFALVSLISFILCLILGIFVYLKQVRHKFDSKLAKTFVLLCLSLAICWALIEFGYRNATNYENAYFWIKINFSWYFVISFLLHFTLILTENSKLLKKKLIYAFIYGPALIFFLIDLNTGLLITEPLEQAWGWTYGIPQFPLVYSIATTWAAFAGVFCIYICLDYYINMNNLSKKKMMKYTIIGFLIPMTVSLQTEWLFPIMNIPFPELIVPALTTGLIIIWYNSLRPSPLKNSARCEEIKKGVDLLIKKPEIEIVTSPRHK